MAGHSVDFIIRLLRDDSELKKQLKLSEKDITKLNAHERAEVKATLQARMDALAAQAKAAKKNPGNTAIVTGMEDELKFMREVFAEMKALNPAEDWAKSGKMFAQTFSNMNQQLSELATIIPSLKSSVEELGTSFSNVGFNITPTIDVKSVTQGVSKTIKGVADVAVSEIHKVSPKIEKAYAKALQFNRDLTKVRGQKTYSFETPQEITNKLAQLQKDFNTASDDASKYFNPEQAALYAQEIMKLYEWMKQFEKQQKVIVSNGIGEYDLEHYRSFVDEQIQIAEEAVQKYNRALEDAQMLNLTDKLTKNLKNLNIRLDLESKAEFTKKVNKYIDDINKKNLHKIKAQFDDTFDLNKKKNNKKGEAKPVNPEEELNEIISKSGLEKFEKAIDKMQGSVKEKTKLWRTEMLKLIEFGKGDFKFSFGNTMMSDLQEFFYEPGHELDIIINEEELKRRIQNVIQQSGGVIGSSGGTATFDPKMMASAVYSAIQAALTGKEMPTFDFGDTVTTTEDVGNATDEANDSQKTYVKTLDESTIHIDKVIESLKKFAQVAPKSKAGRAVDTWFTDRGVDMSLIRAGIDDSEIRTMLQDAWMLEDGMGHAKGSTVVDRISSFFTQYKSLKLDKGAGKALTTLEGDIKEFFTMLEIPLETIGEWTKRTGNIQIYKDAAKYGRGLALLNKFRPLLKTDRDGNRIGAAIKEGATPDDVSKIKIDDVDATIKYFSKIGGIDVKPFEDLYNALDVLGNSTDSGDIVAFQDMVAKFYDNSRKVFEDLNAKYGGFVGEVYLQGRKNSIPINSPKDILNKVPEDAVIIDVVDYVDMGSSRVQGYDAHKSEGRALREQDKQAHQDRKEYEQSILAKEIKVENFKPIELSKVNTNIDEGHYDQQITSLNSEISTLQNRIEVERTTVDKLQTEKARLENEISQMKGEELSGINNGSFKKYTKQEKSINAITQGARNALNTGGIFELDDTSVLDGKQSQLVQRLQSVMQTVNDNSSVSKDLEQKITQIETAQNMDKDALETARQLATEMLGYQEQKRQAQREIEALQNDTKIKENERESKIAKHQSDINYADEMIAKNTKFFGDLQLPVDPNFYKDMLFNQSKIERQFSEYKTQKANIDKQITTNKGNAQSNACNL